MIFHLFQDQQARPVPLNGAHHTSHYEWSSWNSDSVKQQFAFQSEFVFPHRISESHEPELSKIKNFIG